MPELPGEVLLRDRTTLRLGGPARRFVEATTEQELLAEVRSADAAGIPLLLLAGGSNLVVADEGFPGTVLAVATRGVHPEAGADDASCEGAAVRVAAGEDWDALVARAVTSGWVGVEALSGIPGSVGATPVQNVGAYGQEVAETIARVRTWDRREGRLRSFAGAECGFDYRSSRFKAEPGRYVVLEVTFQLPRGELSAPVAYAELARAVDVEIGQRAPMTEVRDSVLRLRGGKGMVLEAADHDTWSAGSFFTNPLLASAEADALPAEAPRWPAGEGRVKTSAAWLIEHAGFGRGFGLEVGDGRVTLSSKHTLAVTNRGEARTDDLLTLARVVRDGVAERFGVRLVNEPVLVGCSL